MQRPVLIALAGSLVLAGCLSRDSPVETASAPPGAPGVVAPATEAGSALAADGLTNGTRWALSQWDNRTELVVFEETVTVETIVMIPGSWCLVGCVAGFFTPAPGLFVPPGASSVELHAEYTLPGTAPEARVRLAYQTAGAGEAEPVEVVSGTPLPIPVGPGDADMPLQPKSLWWFVLYFEPHAPGGHVAMDVQVRLVVKRGAEVPEIPDPPDPWMAGPSRPLVSQAHHNRAAVGLLTLCVDCGGWWWNPGPGGIVPMGATKVLATLSWDWPGPTKPILHYWNSVEEGAVATLVEDGEGARTYEIPVAAGTSDSPYQARSLWGFGAQFETDGVSQGLVDGSLQLDAIVTR